MSVLLRVLLRAGGNRELRLQPSLEMDKVRDSLHHLFRPILSIDSCRQNISDFLETTTTTTITATATLATSGQQQEKEQFGKQALWRNNGNGCKICIRPWETSVGSIPRCIRQPHPNVPQKKHLSFLPKQKL